MFRISHSAVYKLLIFAIFIKQLICSEFNLSHDCEMLGSGHIFCHNIDVPPDVDKITVEHDYYVYDLKIENSRLPILSHLDTQRIRYLTIQNSSVKVIKNDAFSILTDIQNINLDQNLIEEIPANTFKNQTLLLKLYLSNNKIKNINDAAFDGLHFLRTLDLSNNLIESLSQEVFRKLLNLDWMSLGNNKIKTIENSFHKLEILKVLYLQDNLLETIPTNTFKMNKYLGILDISGNRLSNFDVSYFYGLNNLAELLANGNKFTKLTVDAFLLLQNLQFLDLSDNHIVEVEEELFETTLRLTTLNMANNKIKSVDFLQHLCNVQNLILAKSFDSAVDTNRIMQNLAADLRCLRYPELTSLDLSYNNFGHIDISLLEHESVLEELYLEGNQLTNIDIEFLKRGGLRRLRKIGLGQNEWNCTFITRAIRYFSHANITLRFGNMTNLQNKSHRGGIECVDCSKKNSNVRSCSSNSRPSSDGHHQIASNSGSTIVSVLAVFLVLSIIINLAIIGRKLFLKRKRDQANTSADNTNNIRNINVL